MKFNMIIATEAYPEDCWTELEEVDTKDPQEYAENIVRLFNNSLKPGEKKRILLRVEILDKEGVLHHTWEKSNLFTITERGLSYDVYQCKRCKITGKRFGLDRTVKRDPKFKAEVYQRCDTSLDHRIKKRQVMAPIEEAPKKVKLLKRKKKEKLEEKPEFPFDKSSSAEQRYHKKRKRKKKLSVLSRRKNRR